MASSTFRNRVPKVFLIILCVALAAATATIALAATWADRSGGVDGSGTHTWADLAMSSNGATILAADAAGATSDLYLSTDGGVDWSVVKNGGSLFQKQWKVVACSSDCSTMLAGEITTGTSSTGDLWLSTDSGANWTALTGGSQPGALAWTGVAVSSDGTHMSAISDGGVGQQSFWLSTNSGSTWTNPTGGSWSQSSILLHPHALGMSSDGTKFAVAMFGGDGVDNVYLSSGSAATWYEQTNSPSGFWTGVSLSGDGTKIMGNLSFGGDVWVSMPGSFSSTANSWTDIPSSVVSAGGGLWKWASLSNDGKKAAVAASTGTISLFSGTHSDSAWLTDIVNASDWTAQTGGTQPGTAPWTRAVYSSDGTYAAAAGSSTAIWTFDPPPAAAPSVTTNAASSAGATSAMLNGTLNSTGNATITSRGFQWGTDTSYAGGTVAAGGTALGAYTYALTGLTCGGTTYHFRSVATNSASLTGVGSDQTFMTSACAVAPTVTTGSASSTTSATATIGGAITATGGDTITSRYIEYGTSSGTYANQTPADNGSFGAGAFAETARGLAAGTTYFYKACAANSGGTGCGSESSFTTLAAPGAPTGLTPTAGYAQVSLAWTAPVSSGDYAISDYLIEYKQTGGPTWYVWPHAAATATGAVITGLANGTSYTFQVSAVNAAGQGPASSPASASPSSTLTVPGAPTGLAGTIGSGQVSLSWSAPANAGGSAITDYKVEYQTLGAGSWSTFAHSASTATAQTVTGLANGIYYNFRVTALNAIGYGTASGTITTGPGTALYYHIEGTGQSLMEGLNSIPALSTSQPYNNLSLSPSPDAGESAPLIPLVETAHGRESPASGIANSLAAAMSGHPPIIFSSNASNGQTYDQIKKGGTNNNYAIGQMQTSTAQSEVVNTLGGLYQPLATVLVHGEGDTLASTTESAYAADMAQLQSDYQSDWNALTGLNQTIPMFESQVSSFSVGEIALGQLDAAIANPGKIFLVGPKYQLSYYSADHTHLTNTSSRYLGELYAKVMKKVLIDGQSWNPLMPVSVTNVGNVVTIDYHIPTGTLAIDTTNVAARPDDGFEFYQTGGSAISINSVALDSSQKKVIITLSGAPDGTNPHIRYADDCYEDPGVAAISCGNNADSSAVGGNIRDTDMSVSPASDGTGLALYDWAVTSDTAITASTVPDAPTGFVVTPSSAQASLVWTAPDNDGGSAITDYYIEYKTESASAWTAWSHSASTAASATITGLANGTNYDFRVSAVNALGTGAPTPASTAQPSTTPGVPTSLSPAGGASQVTLSWSAPVSDGGAFISDYLIQYRVTGAGSWSVFTHAPSAATSATIAGLASATSYDFQVSATNAAGTGSASTPATASTSSSTVPDAPTGLGATAGNAQVVLSWTAPASDGGSAITDYAVQYRVTGAGSWSTFAHSASTATAQTVTGLANGTGYDFQVAAVNGTGTGSFSGTESAAPLTVPDAPTGLAATAGDAQVSLSWSAPASDGGSAVTDYVIEYRLSSGSGWTTFADGVSSATATVVTGLANGASYDFRVSAANAAGSGSPSGTQSAAPAASVSVVSGGGTTGGFIVHVHPILNTTTAPTVLPSSGAAHPSGTYISPINGAAEKCDAFAADLKIGAKQNDAAQVRLWQAFLNQEVGAKLPLTGYYGPLTFAAVKKFQSAYAEEILAPWGLASPTGYIHQSTRLEANKLLGCSAVTPVTLDNGKTVR